MWQCHLIPWDEWMRLGPRGRPIGAMTLASAEHAERIAFLLSPEYRRDWAGRRPPVLVMLPSRYAWPIDRLATDDNGSMLTGGWTVTGDPPAVTVNPSISLKGRWHGWIRGGVITDDCEGRRYDADGLLLP